jgi:hypothetical protein
MIYKRNIHVRITYPITNIISYSPTREYIYICVCVCVCVCEREREREREREAILHSIGTLLVS